MLQCGDLWQSEYAPLHAAMLRGEMEPRYLVAEGENRQADSLIGSMTLLFATLPQRRCRFLKACVYDGIAGCPKIASTLTACRCRQLALNSRGFVSIWQLSFSVARS